MLPAAARRGLPARGTLFAMRTHRSVSAASPPAPHAPLPPPHGSPHQSTLPPTSAGSVLLDALGSRVDAVAARGVREWLDRDPDTQRSALAAVAADVGGDADASAASLSRHFQRAAATSPDAVDFLRAVRARCMEQGASGTPWARRVDAAASSTLAPLYGPSLLRLQQLSVAPDAPDAVRELVRQARDSEAVHKAANDDAARRKFGPRRVVYALTHSARPTELLAVLYAALLPAPPAAMADIDAATGGEPGAAGHWPLAAASSCPPGAASTAVFYSVGSPNALTRGLGLGTRIIYALAAEIAAAAPPSAPSGGVRTFVTLSPIPEFLRWLKAGAGAGGALPGLLRAYAAAAGSAAPVADAAALAAELAYTEWWSAAGGARRAALQPLLAWLCRHYLLRVRGADGGPACRVAAFHLGNGARMARVCASADTSEAGLKRSAGFMVNYMYSESGRDGLAETMFERAAAYATNPAAVVAAQAPTLHGAAAVAEQADGNGVGGSSPPPSPRSPLSPRL
jgi:hypothetical protein